MPPYKVEVAVSTALSVRTNVTTPGAATQYPHRTTPPVLYATAHTPFHPTKVIETSATRQNYLPILADHPHVPTPSPMVTPPPLLE